MILLDTNVISEPLRRTPCQRVIDWLDTQDPQDLTISTLTLAELRAGVHQLPAGRRREDLADAVELTIVPAFADRILPFNEAASLAWASIQSSSRAAGRPLPVMDSLIAAVARAHGAVLATRNVKDFATSGLDLIDPWREA